MQTTQEKIRELAESIYDLDAEVYVALGSSLGRVFNRDRERCVQDVMHMMAVRENGHVMRSAIALIGNMARTIPDKEERSLVMNEYNRILKEIEQLPTSFGEGDVINLESAKLNSVNIENRFGENDHLIICISRGYGCGGSEIGFQLADKLRINYYDSEIFEEVLKRLEAEKDSVADAALHPRSAEDLKKQENAEHAFSPEKKKTILDRFREFNRYHGLTRRDAVFFNQSDLICDMAGKEDFVIMGRCAHSILTNNRIPHISIFITAPVEHRLTHVKELNPGLTDKQCRQLIHRVDKMHHDYYKFYTGSAWGDANNYDFSINSACYGIEGSVDLILRLIRRKEHSS